MHEQLRKAEIGRSHRDFVAFLYEKLASPLKCCLGFGIVRELEFRNTLGRQGKSGFKSVPEFLKGLKRSTGDSRSILEKIELRIDVGTVDIAQRNTARIVRGLVFVAKLVEDLKRGR
jgi:hypothetical protein